LAVVLFPKTSPNGFHVAMIFKTII